MMKMLMMTIMMIQEMMGFEAQVEELSTVRKKKKRHLLHNRKEKGEVSPLRQVWRSVCGKIKDFLLDDFYFLFEIKGKVIMRVKQLRREDKIHEKSKGLQQSLQRVRKRNAAVFLAVWRSQLRLKLTSICVYSIQNLLESPECCHSSK